MSRNSSLIQAAMVLKRLPKPQAARVLARLEPAEIKQLLDTIKRLEGVSENQIFAAQCRLLQEVSQVTSKSETSEPAQDNSPSANPAANLSDTQPEDPGKSDEPFDFLIGLAPSHRLRMLEEEHPKQIAVVLSMMPPDVASTTMNSFDPALRLSVVKRICDIDEIQEEEISQLRLALRRRLKSIISHSQRNSAGVELAADLLSRSDEESQENMIAYVGQTDPELALKLQRSVFKIEHLELLEDHQIRLLLGNVDTSVWAPALRNASSALKARIFACMAAKPADWLAHEIDQIGHVEPKDEARARQDVIRAVLKLARAGKIDLRQTTSPKIPAPNYRATSVATSPIS